MGDNFLYILGAGASCEAVPLVKDFPKGLVELAQELRNFCISMNSKDQQRFYNEGREQFVEALDWLADEASRHASVDTLAKKFFLKNDQRRLKKLKAVLSSFLVIVQARRGVDKRYDSFLASVLYRDGSGKLQIPTNIRIMTWNYDTQLEKAFYGFSEDNNEVYAKISNNDRIHRINGCCGKTPDGHWGPDFCCVWEASDDIEPVFNGIGLFREYFATHNNPDADIRFAWEYLTENHLPYVLPNLKETTVAVIIGYSFPYFNREVDKKIFGALPNLKRVFLQYPDGVHSTIKERIQAMRPDLGEIQYVISDNQFYIPDEYSGPA